MRDVNDGSLQQFLSRVAEHVAETRIDVNEPAVDVNVADADRREFDHVRVELFALAQTVAFLPEGVQLVGWRGGGGLRAHIHLPVDMGPVRSDLTSSAIGRRMRWR